MRPRDSVRDLPLCLARDLGDKRALPQMARLMLGAFESRSITSHGGELGVMDDDEVRSLRHFVQSFLLAMCALKHSTKEQLGEWVTAEEAKLTDAEKDALKDACDWKMRRDEIRARILSSILVTLGTQNGFGDEAVSSRAHAIAEGLQNAAREGKDWIRDLRTGLEKFSTQIDVMYDRLASGPALPADEAARYYLAVVTVFRKVKWVAEIASA